MKSPVRIFLSSTFRDLKPERKALLNQIGEAFEAIGMETFIPTGKHSQETALDELLKCDAVIFLISPYYGSTIDVCRYKNKCKADCGMKEGKEKISYTWCEYRFAIAEKKPHMVYIIDEPWPSKDGAPQVWKFRKEIEAKEYCPRIKREEWERVVKELVSKLVDWYSDNKINLRNFCGRRNELKELFEELKGGCVEVYGIGGIGKTTLCEIVLYFYKTLGRKIVYIGREEAYSSGTGYITASKILHPKRFKSLSIDTVIDALGLPSEMKKGDTESKIGNILSKIENEKIILFIDDVQEDDDLDELIKKGNTLTDGSILVTSKKELGIANFRIFLKSNNEPECLIKTMASRLDKSESIDEDKVRKIKDIVEGHPIAIYLILSNLKRLGIETLKSFKEGLDFSRDRDVEEYTDRVIKKAVSKDAYNFLKDVSIISNFNDPIEMDILTEVFSKKEVLGEVIDANMMRVEGNTLLWELSQIKDAIFEDISERYRLAYQYYQKRYDKYKEKDDEIKILICKCKTDYKPDIYNRFKDLYSSIKPTESAYELLPALAEEIKKHLEKEEDKAELSSISGNIYQELSNYKDRAENCKKAIKAYDEALKVRTLDRFPMQYASTQNNLGNAYRTLAEVENKGENCKRAIKAYDEALKVFTFDRFPMDYATTQNNLGTAYDTLSEVENKRENCKKAIKAYDEALKVFTLDRFPMDYASTQNNLGVAYRTLSEVENRPENCKRAIKAYEEALKVFTKEAFPEIYPLVASNRKKLLEFCGDNS